MAPLNYRHLEYFRAVAHEGSVTAAAKALHVSQPSVSAQLGKLEQALGYRLFERRGRSMVLTAEGRVVLDYADEISRLGRELEETVRGGLRGRPLRLAIGLAGTIPNLVALHFLEPAFALEDPVRITIREKRADRLLGDLATHELDLVLADMPVPPNVGVKAFNHRLGSSGVVIMGPPLLAHRLREGFPQSLDGQPFLVPEEGYALRRSLDDWFQAHSIQPRVVAEIEDTDLINVLGEGGAGLFAVPAIIVDDIRVRYAVETVGAADGVEEHYFAITADRHLRHPAVAAITRSARLELSTSGSPPILDL